MARSAKILAGRQEVDVHRASSSASRVVLIGLLLNSLCLVQELAEYSIQEPDNTYA